MEPAAAAVYDEEEFSFVFFSLDDGEVEALKGPATWLEINYHESLAV